ENLEALEKELYASGSDRATAVLFASFVETSLQRLLVSLMRPDLNSNETKQIFGFDGALSSFSSMINLGYALNVLGPITRNDLVIIKFVRNEFAHSRMPFDFKTPELGEVCSHLEIIDQLGATAPMGYLDLAPQEELEAAMDITNPKTRFIATCHHIAYRISVKRDGPKEGDSVFPNDEPLP
ncbi:MAG TPA: hypothetical protein VGN05_12820, partial [Parvibaculum sp.]